MEIFKIVKDFENYEVSNYGNIRNIKTNKLMTLYSKKNEYLFVKLYNNGISKEFRVHRLVAIAFIDNPYNYDCVNHKDENKKNNKFDNLEWCDHQYNNTYGNRISKQKEKQYKPVLQYTKEGEFIKEYISIGEAGLENNITPCNITNNLSGRQKTAGGYVWKYKTED